MVRGKGGRVGGVSGERGSEGRVWMSGRNAGNAGEGGLVVQLVKDNAERPQVGSVVIPEGVAVVMTWW